MLNIKILYLSVCHYYCIHNVYISVCSKCLSKNIIVANNSLFKRQQIYAIEICDWRRYWNCNCRNNLIAAFRKYWILILVFGNTDGVLRLELVLTLLSRNNSAISSLEVLDCHHRIYTWIADNRWIIIRIMPSIRSAN